MTIEETGAPTEGEDGMALTGKVALITGASHGVGAATAHAFAAAGAAVLLAAPDSGELGRVAGEIAALGGTAVAAPADVTDEDEVAHLVRIAIERLGGLHLAVNHAGDADHGHGHALGRRHDRDHDHDERQDRAPLAEIPTAMFDAVVRAHLRGVCLCVKHEIPAMLASGGGAIVNACAVAGLGGGAPGVSPYAVAQHGLTGLTRTAALDYAGQGVRVNALAIGPILTEQVAGWPAEERQAAIRAAPMGRLGQPEEVAAAALWLCSDQAAFVTGVVLPVDGGLLATRAGIG